MQLEQYFADIDERHAKIKALQAEITELVVAMNAEHGPWFIERTRLADGEHQQYYGWCPHYKQYRWFPKPAMATSYRSPRDAQFVLDTLKSSRYAIVTILGKNVINPRVVSLKELV
jgi:hypothetical protein